MDSQEIALIWDDVFLEGDFEYSDGDLITEQGIKVVNEKNHAILKGVTAWS